MAETTILNEKTRREVTELIGAEAREGLVPALMLLGTGMAERSASTGVGILRDVGSEAKEAIGAALDLFEAWSKSASRFTRKLAERAQLLGDDSFERGEQTVRVLLRALRSSSDGAASTVSQLASTLVGRPSTASAPTSMAPRSTASA